MATIPASTILKPVGEGFGKKRFIGLEIETTRSDSFFPKPEDEESRQAWDNTRWNLTTKIKNHIVKTLDPDKKYIAMVGCDGDDIEIATQPIALEKLQYDVSEKLLKNIQRYCVACDASGTHIHISKLDNDKKSLWRNLYWFETVFDQQLYAIFRRKSHWALSPKEIFKEDVRFNQYKTLSLKELEGMHFPQYGNKGTIIVNRAHTYECRAGAASTSPKEIRAWAELFYNIVNFCNQGSIVGHRFEEVIPQGDAGELIKTRLTGEQLRQIVPINMYFRR